MPKAKTMLDKAHMYLMRYAPKGRDAVEMQMIARSPAHARRLATNFFDYETREPVRMKDVDIVDEVYGPYTEAQRKLMDRLSTKWAPGAANQEWEVQFDDGSSTYTNAFSADEVFEQFSPLRTKRRILSVTPTIPLL